MAKSSLVYFEDVSIRRSSNSYIVNLELDGDDFYIRNPIIEDIAMKGNTDKNLIAILLAYIEYARRSRNSDENPKARKIENEIVSSVICELLKKYSAEELIDMVKELKWHEICEIFYSQNPILKIEEII